MRRHHSRFGRVLLVAAGLIVGAVVLGKLFKLALVAGAVFVVWKIFFDTEKEQRASALPAPVNVLPPLDLTDRQPDPDRARLDRELERAIAAANARQSAASSMS